jgi:hypothetical protein
VSETENRPVRTEVQPPTLATRLASWFGIYLLAALFSAVDLIEVSGMPDGGIGEWLSFTLLATISFPIIALFRLSHYLLGISSDLLGALILELSVIGAYAAYVVSFYLACSAKTHRVFLSAILILIVLVTSTLTACHYENVQIRKQPASGP